MRGNFERQVNYPLIPFYTGCWVDLSQGLTGLIFDFSALKKFLTTLLYAKMESGEKFAISISLKLMQLLCADNWGSLTLVCFTN